MINVTVIVPNYNHERYLTSRLDSILNQTYKDFQIIILDDKSTDNSRSVIESYGNNNKITSIVYNTENTGSPFAQWIKGVRMVQTEYVWIAESDDYAEPEFLASMMALVKRYNNVGIAYCNSYKVNDEGKSIGDLHRYMDREFKAGPEEVKKLCLYNTITNVSSCLIKTEYALKALDGLEQFKTCGDWIFYSRVLQHCNLAYSDQKLNHYRWHDKSVSFTACTTTAYVAEGIHVIKYIDYKLINFSLKEYLSVFKAWYRKISYRSNAYLFNELGILLVSIYKFFTAKISLTLKTNSPWMCL